jgi:hypothetical protein
LLGQLASCRNHRSNLTWGGDCATRCEFVQRQGDAAELNDELKYLSDMDMARQHDSFALVRIITWATPMLGFLGTVIGITQALGDLDANQLATDIQGAMDGLLSGLYVAFDTTALALSLSVVLMFAMFAIDRLETQVLAQVDLHAGEALMGRFEQVGSGHDPYLTSIRPDVPAGRATAERLVERQTELWQQTFLESQQQWTRAIEGAGKQVDVALRESLHDSLGDLPNGWLGSKPNRPAAHSSAGSSGKRR